MIQDTRKSGRHYLMYGGDHTTRFYQFAVGFQDADFRRTIAIEFMEELGRLQLIHTIGLILVPAIGGIALGATMQHLFYGKKPMLAYTEKIKGVQRLRRGFQLPKNRGIAILDDVISTGRSIRETIQACEEQDAGPVVFCGAVVNRNPAGFPASGQLITIAHKALFDDPIESVSPEECAECRAGIPLEKDGTIIIQGGEPRIL